MLLDYYLITRFRKNLIAIRNLMIRYTPNKSKIVHSKISQNTEGTRTRQTTRYGDDFLARPYLPRKRRSLNNKDVGESQQITFCVEDSNTSVPVEGDRDYGCSQDDDLRIQRFQTSF